jgi:hypothetical protein
VANIMSGDYRTCLLKSGAYQFVAAEQMPRRRDSCLEVQGGTGEHYPFRV